MSDDEFVAYAKASSRDYAKDKVRSGQWSAEESLRLARDSLDSLLPQGLATPDHHLLKIRDAVSQVDVGTLWFAVQAQAGGKIAYVYDVLVAPPFQRRGYASLAFAALEEKVRALGMSTIALHVFGHNAGARALYGKLGYETTNISMSKHLD